MRSASVRVLPTAAVCRWPVLLLSRLLSGHRWPDAAPASDAGIGHYQAPSWSLSSGQPSGVRPSPGCDQAAFMVLISARAFVLPARARASCTDSTGNRMDGTRGAGIIRRPGPRTGPRSSPVPPVILLLCVNVADDMDALGSATSTGRSDLPATIGGRRAAANRAEWRFGVGPVRTRRGRRPGPWWARPWLSRVRQWRRDRRARCRLRSLQR